MCPPSVSAASSGSGSGSRSGSGSGPASASTPPDEHDAPTGPVLTVLGIFGQHDDHPDYCSPKSDGLLRYRLQVTDPEDEDYEVALFRPNDGLIWTDPETGEQTPHDFWHNQETTPLDAAARGDRAVLFQSAENYEALATSPALAAHFHPAGRAARPGAPLSAAEREVLRARVLARPTFGEQVVVSGATPRDVAVGDVFAVAGGASALEVQVTSPRKPCYWIDRKNKTPMGAGGAKAFCQDTGLAGWFARVRVAGELRDGMRLVRTHHPHPEWTLREVSQALYGGEGAGRAGRPSWGRSRGELLALRAIAPLATCEWKEELEKLTAPEEAAPSSWRFPFGPGMFEDVLNLCGGRGGAWCFGGAAATAAQGVSAA